MRSTTIGSLSLQKWVKFQCKTTSPALGAVGAPHQDLYIVVQTVAEEASVARATLLMETGNKEEAIAAFDRALEALRPERAIQVINGSLGRLNLDVRFAIVGLRVLIVGLPLV